MHWIREDTLFKKEDYQVFEFESRESQVVEYRYGNELTEVNNSIFENAASRVVVYSSRLRGNGTPGSLRSVTVDFLPLTMTLRRARQWQSLPDSSRRNGIAIMFCSRAEPGPWPGNIVAELPVCAEVFERLVGTFHIHPSISRVINRNTTANFSTITTQDPETEEVQIIYNCRSASSWADDMALSATFYPARNYTYCVVYGCSEKNRATIKKTLENCNLSTFHPLVIPLLFAEIERNRHFKLTDRIRSKLLTRALNVSINTHGLVPSQDANGTQAGATDTDDTLRLWLDMSHIKNGLDSWRKQLLKITRHAEALLDLGLSSQQCESRPSSTSSGFTPVTTQQFIPDDFANFKGQPSYKDNGEKSKTSLRILARLEELDEEYDEKIRSCSTIVDGMVLATQMEWNEIGRGDTLTNLDISRATRNDGRQMRSIALLTMIFLPATSVATLFSMTFFNWSPDRGQDIMSPYIWLYATVTLVLTGITVGTWYTCNRPRGEAKSLC